MTARAACTSVRNSGVVETGRGRTSGSTYPSSCSPRPARQGERAGSEDHWPGRASGPRSRSGVVARAEQLSLAELPHRPQRQSRAGTHCRRPRSGRARGPFLCASTTDVMLAGNWKTSRMVAHYSAGARRVPGVAQVRETLAAALAGRARPRSSIIPGYPTQGGAFQPTPRRTRGRGRSRPPAALAAGGEPDPAGARRTARTPEPRGCRSCTAHCHRLKAVALHVDTHRDRLNRRRWPRRPRPGPSPLDVLQVDRAIRLGRFRRDQAHPRRHRPCPDGPRVRLDARLQGARRREPTRQMEADHALVGRVLGRNPRARLQEIQPGLPHRGIGARTRDRRSRVRGRGERASTPDTTGARSRIGHASAGRRRPGTTARPGPLRRPALTPTRIRRVSRNASVRASHNRTGSPSPRSSSPLPMFTAHLASSSPTTVSISCELSPAGDCAPAIQVGRPVRERPEGRPARSPQGGAAADLGDTLQLLAGDDLPFDTTPRQSPSATDGRGWPASTPSCRSARCRSTPRSGCPARRGCPYCQR